MSKSACSLPDISQRWKFKLGDDASWSDPLLDDSDWQPIHLAMAWEKQGYPDYDGYACYRIHIRLCKSLQRDPSFPKYQMLRITLGQIEDVDQTWFNGKIIGKTGSFPDSYKPAWLMSRVYTIPAALIHWDTDNVLAVRVYDGNGEGGCTRGTIVWLCQR